MTDNGSEEKRLDFHFIKSNQFRVISIDGAWGGPEPRGKMIGVSVYSERNAIPLKVTHELDEAGRMGRELGRSGRSGIVREIEAHLVMTPETARSFANWLNEKADLLLEGEARK